MSIFFTDKENEALHKFNHQAPYSEYAWALHARADKYAANPGLVSHDTTVEWWHCCMEYLTDAAMSHKLRKNEVVGSWVRSTTLSLVRRSKADWIGPWFREHAEENPTGHLETAHLSVAVAVAYDLCRELFTGSEITEIENKLRDEAIPLCLEWVKQNNHMANWRCIMTAGFAVPAAVLGDSEMLKRAAEEYSICNNIFQEDGTYGESLQYSHYALWAQTLTYEAIVRADSSYENKISAEAYAGNVVWAAYSIFYKKPLEGFGSTPFTRAANFNDSAAIFTPMPDVLCHISSRLKDKCPKEAAIAKWLLEEYSQPTPDAGPFDQASFGFINKFGFLTLAMYAGTAEAESPEELELPVIGKFEIGDVIARDKWNGKTVLATHGGGEKYSSTGHLHGDLNSFILTHNDERLLVDPGHSCYRGLIHGMDTQTSTHSTCTFQCDSTERIGLQEEQHSTKMIQQTVDCGKVIFNPEDGTYTEKVDRGAVNLIAEEIDELRIIGSDAGAVYGEPINEFSRFWIMCGANALFVVDFIEASTPVETRWHWLFNDRDGKLQLKPFPQDRVVARRGKVGMKLFNVCESRMIGPQYSFVHDAYHPLPNQLGEGKSGSGKLMTWQSTEKEKSTVGLHAIALDNFGSVAGWHLRSGEDGSTILEGPNSNVVWALKIDKESRTMTISEKNSGREYVVAPSDNGNYAVKKK